MASFISTAEQIFQRDSRAATGSFKKAFFLAALGIAVFDPRTLPHFVDPEASQPLNKRDTLKRNNFFSYSERQAVIKMVANLRKNDNEVASDIDSSEDGLITLDAVTSLKPATVNRYNQDNGQDLREFEHVNKPDTPESFEKLYEMWHKPWVYYSQSTSVRYDNLNKKLLAFYMRIRGGLWPGTDRVELIDGRKSYGISMTDAIKMGLIQPFEGGYKVEYSLAEWRLTETLFPSRELIYRGVLVLSPDTPAEVLQGIAVGVPHNVNDHIMSDTILVS